MDGIREQHVKHRLVPDDRGVAGKLRAGYVRRRGLGEKIVVAQNMFEPTELNGPVVRPPSEQGDGDQNSLKIELAQAPASKAGRIDIVENRRQRESKAKWAVQVGEFRSKTDAHRQIALVEKKFAEHVDGARGAAEKQGRNYKAVFTGLTEADAKDACHAMKAKRLACMVISPA